MNTYIYMYIIDVCIYAGISNIDPTCIHLQGAGRLAADARLEVCVTWTPSAGPKL